MFAYLLPKEEHLDILELEVQRSFILVKTKGHPRDEELEGAHGTL